MADSDFLIDIANALQELAQPLTDAVGSPGAFSSLMLRYGWQPPADTSFQPQIQAVLGLTTELPALITATEAVVNAPEPAADDVEALLSAAIDIIGTIVDLAKSGTPAGLTSAPDPLGRADFWQTFPLELSEGLLANYIEHAHPAVFAPLHLLGLIDTQWTPANSAAFRVDYFKTTLNFDRLGTLLTDPGALAAQVYGWGGASFDYVGFLNRLVRVFQAFDLPVDVSRSYHPLLTSFYVSPPVGLRQLHLPLFASDVLQSGGVSLYLQASLYAIPIPAKPYPSSGPPAGFLIAPYLEGAAGVTISLGNSISLGVSGSLTIDGLTGLEILPAGVGAYLGSSSAASYDLGVTLSFQPPLPQILLGRPDSHRLQIDDAKIGFDLQGDVTAPELGFSMGTTKISLILDFSSGDSFLNKIFGTDTQTFEADGTITWSSKNGLTFSGHAGITLQIPINQTIGVVELDTLLLGAEAGTSGGLGVVIALSGGLTIGPVQASVDKIGIELTLTKPAAGSPPGVLGGLDLGFGFKPPDGIGLAIDAGPISGGGYLMIDTANGRYAGILQLTLPVVSIVAIGLLDTKLPGGKKGYSLLIILTCDFAPIQLGYGFVLAGLGGLAGINRTIVVQALQDGVHSGSVDDILFPEDPVGHATQLISDLETIFPPTEGQYVFGPMAELGWGEPDPLITAQLGIILTLPNPLVIVLLGKLELALPEPDSPVVDLRIEIAGSLDLTNKLLAIDTTLRDSRILAWSLSGDTSLRLAFGSQPNFVFAIGGFNSHFQPPPNFPSLQRMTLALSTGDDPRLMLDCYMAVTSNTFQVGAQAQVYASLGDFKASGDLGFDALFHFQPFSFLTDVEADVAVTGPLGFSAGIHLDAHLSGPDPVHCWGTLVIQCIGTHHVPIDIPFGQPAVETPVSPPDVWGQLKGEIALTGNWTAVLPDNGNRTAILVQSQGAAGLAFVEPCGGLTLRQKALPLDTPINKFGNVALTTPQRFSITGVSIGSINLSANSMTAATGQFAAAQFEQMSDADQLSRPSFEPMNAGVTIADSAVAFGATRGRDYKYDTITVDSPAPTNSYRLSAAAQQAAHRAGPAAKAPANTTGLSKYAPAPSQPPAARLSRAKYLIANVASMQDATSILGAALGGAVPVPNPPEKGAMLRALDSYYAAIPADRGKYAVMGAWELT